MKNLKKKKLLTLGLLTIITLNILVAQFSEHHEHEPDEPIKWPSTNYYQPVRITISGTISGTSLSYTSHIPDLTIQLSDFKANKS